MTTDNSLPASGFRKKKKIIKSLLADNNYEQIMSDRDDSTTYRALNSLMFDGDSLIKNRAIQVIGLYAGEIYKRNPNKVREYIRRFFWTMNDESGNLCWHAPEAIGEILYNVPELLKDNGLILASFTVEEPFEAGVRLAISRVAEYDKLSFFNAIPFIKKSLRDDKPMMRASSILALKAMNESIDNETLVKLKEDQAVVSLYDYEKRKMTNYKIMDLIS